MLFALPGILLFVLFGAEVDSAGDYCSKANIRFPDSNRLSNTARAAAGMAGEEDEELDVDGTVAAAVVVVESELVTPLIVSRGCA